MFPERDILILQRTWVKGHLKLGRKYRHSLFHDSTCSKDKNIYIVGHNRVNEAGAIEVSEFSFCLAFGLPTTGLISRKLDRKFYAHHSPFHTEHIYQLLETLGETMRSRLSHFAPSFDLWPLPPVKHEDWQDWEPRQSTEPEEKKTEGGVVTSFCAKRRVMIPDAGVDPNAIADDDVSVSRLKSNVSKKITSACQIYSPQSLQRR